MFTFRIADHSKKPGIKICEIIQKNEVVGAIYPTKKGIKVVSRYLLEDPESKITIDRDKLPSIPAIVIGLIE
jgi:hypothetical protein